MGSLQGGDPPCFDHAAPGQHEGVRCFPRSPLSPHPVPSFPPSPPAETTPPCPGRLADLLRQRALTLDAVEVVVVDEADRMSDMGFLPDVRRILDLTPANRQTMLFSATLDGAVGVLSRNYQSAPAAYEIVDER